MGGRWTVLVVLLCWGAGGGDVAADEFGFPVDFPVPPELWGGVGGGSGRAEREGLRHYPVILVAASGRSHRDWLGENTGRDLAEEQVAVYHHLLAAGFLPVEVWMPDFAAPGDRMTSLEEATDDLKYFIAAVMGYTGADRVQLVAHGDGGLLVRLTLNKYRIAHWVESEVYIGTPFGGLPEGGGRWDPAAGDPNLGAAASPALRQELLGRGDRLRAKAAAGPAREVAVVTVGNGSCAGPRSPWCPDVAALLGTDNLRFPGLDVDGLRCSACVWARLLPFLERPAKTVAESEDEDRDGYRGERFGGPDCNDGDARVYPGAREIPMDGIDQDCNGHEYSPHLHRDGEVPLSR